MDAENPLVGGFLSTFRVPTRRTVSGWADAERVLPSKGSAEPGRYRSSRTPYMVEVMDCLSTSSPVQDVSLMAGAQTGKSESGNNWVGYIIREAPGPMLLVQPTVDNAKRYSKQRISPMILETPELSALVVDNKSRDSGNTMLEKEFPGGILLLGGANSAAGLRSMPIRYLFADEISNWPADVDGEGDPLKLAVARTSTFGRKRKIFKCSTPGIAGVCRIETEYLKGDQRKYFVPCPHCGHMHELTWDNFVIPVDADGCYDTDSAHMRCPSCKRVIRDSNKTDMLSGGEWRVTCQEHIKPTRRSYHISALYSPVGWKSWAEVATEWVEAQGSAEKLKAFYNNVLAKTYKAGGDRVSDVELYNRAQTQPHDYDGRIKLPEGVLLLTAGVDVQPDRLELELVGWGLGEESWSIDYRVLMGDPNTDLVWQQLDAFLQNEYTHPSGVILRCARTFVDTKGENTKAVYAQMVGRSGMGVFGIMGMGGDGLPAVGTPRKTSLSKTPIIPLGTFALKDSIYGALACERPGPGYCHFPKRYQDTYYKGLTAEEVRVKINTKGFQVREWHKVFDRNEPLDCRVYAMAAMVSLNINFELLLQSFYGEVEARGRTVRGQIAAAA